MYVVVWNLSKIWIAALIRFDVRRSLEPFKNLDRRFDPSSTALAKRSQTLSNGTCVSRILSASI